MRSDTRSPSEAGSIEEELTDFEHKLLRLRIAYDRYFMGSEQREPTQLRGELQRFVTRYMSSPPRNAALKFRFNSLVARFQSFRAVWGRSLREIEAGTYKRHLFREKLAELERGEGAGESARERESARESAPAADARPAAAIDRLYGALSKARAKTGEGALDRDAFAKLVHKQTEELRGKYGKGKVRFKVVIENNRAKLKATVRR